ncbi:MAG: lysozyme inhibitor LprI family protein [Oribacterium sp.]
MRSEERIRIPARRREKAHRPPRPGQRLLLLLLFCILFSAVFQGILQFRLRRYYEGRTTEELSPGESLPETDLIEHSPELESPSERFRLELSRLSEEQAALRRQRSRIAAREQEQQIAALWDTELQRISAELLSQLSEKKRADFRESQKQFRRERRLTAMKEVNTGGSAAEENIAYLKKYAELTERRCYELLERLPA